MSARVTHQLVGAATVVVTIGALSAVGVAGAGQAGARTADVAYVRTAHLSPDTPKVDVYLTAFSGGSTKLWLSGVGYGDVSAYKRMPAGQYAVAMRPTGAAQSTPAALSWSVTLRPGASYTAAAIGKQAQLHGMVIPDATTAPRPGTGLVRVVQASDQAKNVSVTAGRTTVTGSLGFGAVSHYVSVPAGRVPLTAKAVGSPSLADSRTVQVGSRSATTVLLLDEQGGGLQARPLVDAAGPAHAPTGSVETGGGGTAAQVVDGSDVRLTALLILMIVFAGGASIWGVTVARRRRALV